MIKFSEIIDLLRRKEEVVEPPTEVLQVRLKYGWKDVTTRREEGVYRKLTIYPDGRVDISDGA